MGVTTYIKGAILIEPPIPWDVCKDSDWIARQGDHSPLELKLRIAELPVNTAEGVLIRRHADAVVGRWEDEPRAEYAVQELQEIIDEFGDGRVFTGRLDMECRDFMEQWRLKVVGGKATRFDPVTVWPEGSE
jgi:hypothetical protein